MSQKVLLTSKEINIILHRLACQLLENHLDFNNTALIGLQPRGIYVAQRLANILQQEYGVKEIELGFLDITFYRDDFRRGEKPLTASTTERPNEIELLTLIDRRFSRHLPIQPNYRGRQVDAINEEKVKVMWAEHEGEDKIYLVNR